MTDSSRTPGFLRHIVDAIDQIQQYTADLNEQGFLANRRVQGAVVRNLDVIGEACSNARTHDRAFVDAHPEIPWGSAIGNRNALSHGCFSVSHPWVWNTVQRHLPAQRQAVAALLS